ncbi:ribbon-helix-helix protein, CopG family [bacterium]|nr:ribbon-helix-helix protein, CopG family [bacterium]
MAKVLVTMPEEFLSKVDVIANSEQRTRSELIREALRGYMHKRSIQNPEKASKNAEFLDELIG